MPVLADLPTDLLPVMERLAGAMRRVETVFDAAVRSDLPAVQTLVQHVESYRGKMLRPQLVVLCAQAAAQSAAQAAPVSPIAEPRVTDEQVIVAAVCEMIHMATLVHDDVLDEADVRRKGSTVNRLRGNEAAVILGDYLFSSAFRLCSTLDSQQASLLIGATGMALCSGELLQLHHRENFSLDQATYFRIVEQKTASLIATACRLGAMLGSPGLASNSAPDAALPERFHRFGMAIGVAFQIQDDLLDLTGDQGLVGKPLHRDVELGKLTLPLIHHLATASPDTRGSTLMLLRSAAAISREQLDALTHALHSTGSIAHARAAAESLVERAKDSLAPLADSPEKRLLLFMADQVVTRNA